MGIIALIKDGGKGNFSNYTLSNQINLSYLQSICEEKKTSSALWENQNSMKSTNIVSYIGLTIFTVYAIFYWISPNMADLALFFLFLVTFGILALFLLVSCGYILYSCINAFLDKENIHYRICAIWTALLIIFWIVIPSGDCDPYIQEEYYEDHKEELWEMAYQIDYICKNKGTKFAHIWKDDDENHTSNGNGLTREEIRQIQKIIQTMDFESVSYSDSLCSFGFRYVGLALYSFELGLHESKIDDDYTRIIYNDSVAFYYGCGAIGNCSYPNKEEYLQQRQKK